MNEKKSIWEYTPEELEAIPALSLDDPPDFSYPEGFIRTAKALTIAPDTSTQLQMLYGFASFVVNM